MKFGIEVKTRGYARYQLEWDPCGDQRGGGSRIRPQI